MGKGLDKQRIIEASLQMIDSGGRQNFSLHRLAETLGIRTASLYNHIHSLNDLLTAVCAEAIRCFVDAEKRAIEGKTGDDAIRALAVGYVRFAREHYELYNLFMESRQPRKELLEQEGRRILEPVFAAFSEIALPDEEKVHWERILRSILHGFIAQERAGFFTFHAISSTKSFEKAIDCFLTGIHCEESRNTL